MNKITIAIISVIILCFGGLVAWRILGSEAAIDVEPYNSLSIIAASADNGQIGDHVRGKVDSPVIMVEYADIQCPGCSVTHPKVSGVFEEYGDRVAFVFRNFPISGHQNARAAASVAEAAGMQGRFFEMIEILYANQAVWSYASGAERTEVLVDLFAQIAPDGDTGKFKSDMGSSKISRKITFDYELGVKKDEITGTPAILINGEAIDINNPPASEDLAGVLREKLDAKLAEFDLPTGPSQTAN